MTTLTNEKRAEHAMSGVKSYANETGLDPLQELGTAVGDLLASMMHLCDKNGLDFEEILASAKRHHSAEVEEESSSQSPKRIAHDPVSHPEEWENGVYMGSDGYTMHLDAGGFFDEYFSEQRKSAEAGGPRPA